MRERAGWWLRWATITEEELKDMRQKQTAKNAPLSVFVLYTAVNLPEDYRIDGGRQIRQVPEVFPYYGGLVKADNLLGALSIVYPTEENTAVYGPLAKMDYQPGIPGYSTLEIWRLWK